MQELIILICIGLAAGILSGMFGVGGGLIVVPALVWFLAMNQHSAQGTSLGMILLPVGILAVINYYQAGSINIKYSLIIAAAFVIGGYLGSKVSLGMAEGMLKKIFGFFMLLVALKIIFLDK
ncbi:sulfite exporter TauE/SafE family protein [bacterium SCSIO 12741]|nr:sulfite exporter TauE/SafE family protein [bacterium SCSIO 12741]